MAVAEGDLYEGDCFAGTRIWPQTVAALSAVQFEQTYTLTANLHDHLLPCLTDQQVQAHTVFCTMLVSKVRRMSSYLACSPWLQAILGEPLR